MRRLRRLVTLTPLQRRLLIRALFLVSVIRICLWLLPFRTVWRWLATPAEGVRDPDPDPTLSASIAWAVTTVSRYVPAATCLTQALAALSLLRQWDLPATLQIGVARGDGARLLAHAWVESGGKILIGGQRDTHYTPLTAQLPGEGGSYALGERRDSI